MKKRILVLEDDELLSLTLKSILSKFEEYKIERAASLKKAFELSSDMGFELIIVDRNLEDGDGIEFVKYIRENSPATKILFLTSKGELDQRLEGFKAGADDYLPKPFSKAEFEYRVMSLLSLKRLSEDEKYRIEDLVFYPKQGVVIFDDGKKLHLRPKENDLLYILVLNAPRIVDRDKIIDFIWGTAEDAPSKKSLDVYIRRLRMKLGKKAGSKLKTSRGFGFSLDIKKS